MADQILLTPQRALDENANAEPGAKAYFYEAGTSTPMTVYSDSGLTTAHPSPLVADSEGNFAQVFFSGATGAKVDMYDASDVQMTGYPIDDVPTIGTGTSAASDVSFTPTAGNAATDVQAAIENSLSAANNLSDLGNAATSRSNLGAAAASHSHTAVDLPSATTTGAGIVEKSTSAENVAGTATGVYPDVAGVKEMVDTHAVSALSNSYLSTAQTITSGGLLTLAHGLGEKPKIIQPYIKCTTANAGYSVGDEVFVSGVNNSDAGTARSAGIYFDGTNINYRFTSNASCFRIGNKGTGASEAITNGSWEFYMRAFA